MIELNNNQWNGYRGLHIVVLNPFTGRILIAKVFDTYRTCEGFDGLDEFISYEIPANYIVIAACKDECTTNLSKKGKRWFANMGSEEIWKL